MDTTLRLSDDLQSSDHGRFGHAVCFAFKNGHHQAVRQRALDAMANYYGTFRDEMNFYFPYGARRPQPIGKVDVILKKYGRAGNCCRPHDIYRWTVRFALLLLERFNGRNRTVTRKWHVDETYIKVCGR